MEPAPTTRQDHVTVTPDMARSYLAKNTANRPVRREQVQRIKQDILAGRWHWNGNPLVFDPDGVLLAGQHRCLALLAAAEQDPDVTIETDLIHGAGHTVILTSNAAVPTSAADALRLSGYANAVNLAAAARVHYAYTSGQLTHAMVKHRSLALTHQGIIDYLGEHPDLEQSVSEASRLLSKEASGLIGPPAAFSAAHYVLTQIDAEAAEEFFERAAHLMLGGETDPVAVMVRRLQREYAVGRGILPATVLFIVFRSWNAYRDGERIYKIQLGNARGGWATIPTPR